MGAPIKNPYDFQQQDNADLRIYSIQKKLIHWKVYSASWRSGPPLRQQRWHKFFSLVYIGAFYNIIKSWYGTSPYADCYGLNLGSDLTSDQDREITDILRKRILILSNKDGYGYSCLIRSPHQSTCYLSIWTETTICTSLEPPRRRKWLDHTKNILKDINGNTCSFDDLMSNRVTRIQSALPLQASVNSTSLIGLYCNFPSRQSFTFLNFLRNLSKQFIENLAFFGNMALKTNNPITVHISQWVILVNKQINVRAYKKWITFSKT